MRRLGTTLVEMLVAVVFLGFTASSILGALSYCTARSAYTKRRAIIFETAKTILDQARANATGGTISNVTTTKTINGVYVTFKLYSTVSPGFTSLGLVASWQEPYLSGTRTDRISFATLVVPNET